MVIAINILLTAICLLIFFPLLAFTLECFLSILPARRQKASVPERHVRTAVVIPAHNEQLVLSQTLRTLLSTLEADDRVVVVADNCDDQTAAIALASDVEVLQRHDPARRSKGYALDFAVDYLRQNPPEVVVFLDADCLVAENTIKTLAQRARETLCQVQALNLTDRFSPEGGMQVLAVLANRFTNFVRPLGLSRLGLPCRLMGTGVAMPWALVESLQMGGDNLVEDMQWGIDLALAGHWPLFCPEASVTSAVPTETQAFASQRKRWEHGHLRTLFTQVPRLLATALLRRDLRLFCMTWDLSIPPLSLLAVCWAAAIIICLTGVSIGASWIPATILAVGGMIMSAAFVTAWFVHCRRQVPFTALIKVPMYVMRKLPIYFAFVFHPQKKWVRTQRCVQSGHSAPLKPLTPLCEETDEHATRSHVRSTATK
ncbi:MAG: glycosyltransferase family 2 protein [Thermoguttaceae bacterium]